MPGEGFFQSLTRPPRKKTLFGLLAVVVWVDLFVVGILSAVVFRGYVEQTEKAALVSENVSRVLDQNLLGLKERIDLTTLAVVEDVEEVLRKGEGDKQENHRLLIHHAKRMRELLALTVFDRDGRIVDSSLDLYPGDMNISDEAGFQELRDRADAGLLVSEPRLGRVLVMPIIILSRAYHTPDGAFAGIVSATIALKSFLPPLSSVDVGPRGNAALWGAKMGLLVRYSPQPSSSPVQTAPSPELSRLIDAGAGATVFHAAPDFDGEERIVSFRQVSGWPLYLLVGVAADDYLGAWRSLATVLIGVAVVFVLVSLATFRAFARMLLGLKDNETRLRLALEASQQGWFEVNFLSGKIIGSDDYMLRLGFDPAALHREVQTDFSGIHPDDRLAMSRSLKDCLLSDTPLDVDYRRLTESGDWSWMRTVGRVVERDDAGHPVRLLGTHMDISERKQSEQMIKELAYFDSLTKLPNRRLLLDRIGQALIVSNRTKCHGGILFVDLDNFKTLNDSQGHAQGDLLLQEVARRLASSIRESDTVARLGGDEFVIMVEGLVGDEASAVAQITRIGEKALEALSQPYLLLSRDFHCSASIGAVVFAPDRHPQPEELLKRADIAMYHAKSTGRARLQFFAPFMQAVIEEKASLGEEMRDALRNEQFRLYYQPQIEGSRVVGAEALIRWRRPGEGLVSPSQFIPLAEENGLIVPLGDWVLRKACEQIVAWGKAAETRDFFVAVNVSAHQFHQKDFVSHVLSTIESSGADPRRLKLELTESALLYDIQDIIKKMRRLKAEGILFSLDDFGTGYSSLSYLRHLPFDQLKIDQSFVSGIQEDANKGAIAKTIVMLGQLMGLAVIAEGVETREQQAFLASIGCHAYQGYLFSPPVPIETFRVDLTIDP